jgi:hypothetical protein
LSLKIGEKGLAGRIRATKEGRPNQTTPYGMAKVATSPTGEKIVVARTQIFSTPKTWDSEFCPGDAVEVEAMQFAYRHFLEHDLSYSQLAVLMSQKGFPGPTGQGWRADSLQWMLRNPVLSGGLLIGGVTKGKFFRTSGGSSCPASQAQDSDAVLVWDCHEGIIDRTLWNAVQAKMARNFKKRRPPRNSGPYALSGVLYCGNCGHPMYGAKNENGKVIYRCHRKEVNPAAGCGYWLGYEEKILPYLLGDFFAQVRDQIIQESSRVEVIQDDTSDIRQALAKMDAKLKRARTNFLLAEPELAAGLHDTLAALEAERSALAAKLAEASKPRESKLLQWWDRYQAEFFAGNPVELPGIRIIRTLENEVRIDELAGESSEEVNAHDLIMGGNCTVVQMTMPASVLREKLKRIDCRVSVWFKPKAKGRGYDMHRLRCQAYIDGQVCYEETAKAVS